MYYKILFILVVLFSYKNSNAQVGYWKTFDINTGNPRSIVEVYENSSGFLIGKIVKILDPKMETGLCEKCPPDQRGKPRLGLVIMWALEKVGEAWYSNGKILDPDSGNDYGCEVWLDGSDILKVRAKHWTGIYKTVTWYAAPKP